MEWAHAIAPGAQIILVEANSQSLSDLMAGVATAANQPGVSVVSMSWGFPEGQAVLAQDEALYDGVLHHAGRPHGRDLRGQHRRLRRGRSRVPRLLAQRGGGRRHEPHSQRGQLVQQRDGLGLLLQRAWARSSAAAAASACTSREPAYQQGVQSTGCRTTPDVSLRGRPGHRGVDRRPVQPAGRQPVGGRGRHQPVGPGLGRPDRPGRPGAGGRRRSRRSSSAGPTETQQALYSLPASDFNAITSGSNGYSAAAGYNLVTGLGTPVANLLVPDLIAYQGTSPTNASRHRQRRSGSQSSTSGSSINAVFNVFDAVIGGQGGQVDVPRFEGNTGPARTLTTPAPPGRSVGGGGRSQHHSTASPERNGAARRRHRACECSGASDDKCHAGPNPTATAPVVTPTTFAPSVPLALPIDTGIARHAHRSGLGAATPAPTPFWAAMARICSWATAPTCWVVCSPGPRSLPAPRAIPLRQPRRSWHRAAQPP